MTRYIALLICAIVAAVAVALIATHPIEVEPRTVDPEPRPVTVPETRLEREARRLAAESGTARLQAAVAMSEYHRVTRR